MKNEIPLFETRDSLRRFLEKENSNFSNTLKELDFKVDYVRNERSLPWKFSLYTSDYAVPNNFKFYEQTKNVSNTNYSPYDLSVSWEERSKDTKRVINGPKIKRIKFCFYKDEEISGEKCRIFLEDMKLENGYYNVLSEKNTTKGLIRFPVESIKIEEFYSYWGMKKDLVQSLISEVNERRVLISKTNLIGEI